MKIASFDIFVVDVPFRRALGHSAAKRSASESVFVKCTTDQGAFGYGECLPRTYVTGEDQDSTYTNLKEHLLPRLIGREFASFEEVWTFLDDCDGKAPDGWLGFDVPQSSAWCAVDLALLDAFGRAFGQSVFTPEANDRLASLRYSGVLPYESGNRLVKLALLFRLYGLRRVKVKVGRKCDLAVLKKIRTLLGKKADIRVDANMAWTAEYAAQVMQEMARLGVNCFEQPLPAEALDETAWLIQQTGLVVMADESLSDRRSLDRLIEKKAFNAINVRISKCGGLAAALRRCRQARDAGLAIQVGCQVGETSLLSAAQLALCARFEGVSYLEGCFGRHLLKEDVAAPVLEFGYGGRPPRVPSGPGFGVHIDEDRLRRWSTKTHRIGA